ncbi:hypothetical protein HRbin14_02287 [bacterium HR14]|nr:hypothetical protein HRbin14_02287 [bacterium HR14]
MVFQRRAVGSQIGNVSAFGHGAGQVPVGGHQAERLIGHHLAADAGDFPVLVASCAAQGGQEVPRLTAVGVFGEHIIVVAQPWVLPQIAVRRARLQDFIGEGGAHFVHHRALRCLAGEKFGTRVSVPLTPETKKSQLHKSHARMIVIPLPQRANQSHQRLHQTRVVVIRRETTPIFRVGAHFHAHVYQPLRHACWLTRIVQIHAKHHMVVACEVRVPALFPLLEAIVVRVRFQLAPRDIPEVHAHRQVVLREPREPVGRPALERIVQRTGRRREDHRFRTLNLLHCR